MAARPATSEMGGVASALQRAWLTRNPISAALWPLSLLFTLVAATRTTLFGIGLLKVTRLPVPVVVVGNLIVGGAGKTPAVLAVVALLRQRGFAPGIVSRGYGRRHRDVAEVTAMSRAEEVGDEPLMLQRRAGVPVFVGADRSSVARALLLRHPNTDIIVSDDGLQHRRLHRDAQVLVFDERGIGNGWRLPAGPLREAFGVAPPPRSVVLYNGDRATTPWRGHLGERHLRPPVPLSAWARGEARHGGDDWAPWRDRAVIAAAGVARPERFFAMLRAEGLVVTALPLPDHFDFRESPWPHDGRQDIVVTEKDAVKLDPRDALNQRVWVAALDFSPDDTFAPALLELIGAGPASTHGKRHGTTPL